MREIAYARPRFGYPRIHVMLRREAQPSLGRPDRCPGFSLVMPDAWSGGAARAEALRGQPRAPDQPVSPVRLRQLTLEALDMRRRRGGVGPGGGLA